MTPWSTSSGSSGTNTFWSPFPPPIFRPAQAVMSIHRHLCHNTTDPHSPPELLWDIIHPPDFARVRNPHFSHFWEKPDLDADSIQPSVKKVWIDCDHHVLSYWFQKWGHINVTSDSDRVTVRQVLEGIYSYLRTPLTEDDLRELNTVPGNDEGLRIAREKRAKDSYEIDAVVLANGFRRVDVAGSHRRFQGVRIAAYPDHTWKLHFNLLPGSVPRQY